MTSKQVQGLVAKMEESAASNRTYALHWDNDSPASWLARESRDALDNKLARLSVNFVRLAVSSLVERLTLRGFTAAGSNVIDSELIALAQQVNLPAIAELVHTDRALFGKSYATVWTTLDGKRPVLISDTGATAATESDPATGETIAGARVWRRGDFAHAVHFTQDKVQRYKAEVIAGTELTAATEWKSDGKAVDNPLEAVPIVEFTRRQSSLDFTGTSAVADILDLSDALAKVLADAMVSSEYYAKPRRYATGLEIMEDESGKPIDPFGKSRLLQSEDPETRFGQLPASVPTGQTELIATLTQQIGALTGLPAHYLGLHGDQPPSAEGVRAAETQLIMTAKTEMKQLTNPWGRVASLLLAIKHEGHPDDYPRLASWENPEIKTPSQAADAAGKLRDIGIPLATLLSDPLGYPAEEIADIVEAAARESVLDNLGTGLGGGGLIGG